LLHQSSYKEQFYVKNIPAFAVTKLYEKAKDAKLYSVN